MRLSHSKLSKIMSCPMSYRLSYVLGISTKVEKPALSIGSAVHWGIEHETYDLQDYYKEQGSFKQGDAYTREQVLSEAMVYGYLQNKDKLFDEVLKDPETGERLELVDESHELYITGKLKSHLLTQEYHEFVGIIDLLLLTNKGFVIIDYKTSSYEPDWDGYLDQIYRYIFLLQSEFPDIPVVKVGIINIRKTSIRQKKLENESQFLNRMMFEYKSNAENFVNYHEFPKKDIDEKLLKEYIDNLSTMADTAQTIIDNKLYFINYSAAKGQYGKSDYYDIFYHTPNAHVLYQISDYLWDDALQIDTIGVNENGASIKRTSYGGFVDKRDCIELDMLCSGPDYAKVLNKYSMFESEFVEMFKSVPLSNAFTEESKIVFLAVLKHEHIVDEDLLEKYWETLIHKHQLGLLDETIFKNQKGGETIEENYEKHVGEQLQGTE